LEVFSPDRIPGLTIDPGVRMLTETAVVERNTTDQPHIPASGGVQRFEASLNEGLSGGDFSYWRYRADIRQFFPLSEDKRKVLAFRARVETVQEKGGSAIPFLDLPLIGSRSTVRGFESRRFVDGSAMNLSLEYRYRIYRHFDWAVFVDTGQVAHEIGDFGWDRFHTGYGMRFIARAGKNAFSIDIARSPEAWKVYLDFSPTF
jgi:outer membrane protein assembly factor BamA